MKKIRLTESHLHEVLTESVKKVLREMNWDDDEQEYPSSNSPYIYVLYQRGADSLLYNYDNMPNSVEVKIMATEIDGDGHVQNATFECYGDYDEEDEAEIDSLINNEWYDEIKPRLENEL